MRVAYLKVAGGVNSARWIACTAEAAELAVTGVPDEIAAASVAVAANTTLILAPSPKGTGNLPSVDFARLGPGKQVNLYRGRPPVPPEDRSQKSPRSVRLDPDRWAKLQRLGTQWLERAIDEAPEQ